jgi:hypothetical protein
MVSYSNIIPTIIKQTWSIAAALTTVSVWIIKITICNPSQPVPYIQHILIPHQDYQCFITPSSMPPFILRLWSPYLFLQLYNHHYPLVHHHLSINNIININIINSINLWRAVVVQHHSISISLYSVRSHDIYHDYVYVSWWLLSL